LFPDIGLGIGCSILGAWVSMGMGHTWCSERSWVDRAGRILGVFWILFLIVSGATFIASQFR
jgi:hypothetical protein